MPQPSYSPTDIGVALVTVVFAVLDVLTGYGVLPALNPQTRGAVITSLTVLTVAGITVYAANRGIKHLALSRVEAARLSSSHPVPSAPGLQS